MSARVRPNARATATRAGERLGVGPSRENEVNRPATSYLGLLLLLALASLSCAQERPISQNADRVADESAIRAVLAANEAATNRRDSEGVAATFTPDADLLVANGPKFLGINEIQRNEEQFYSTPGLREWRATVEAIRFLSDDVALVEQIATTTLDAGDTHENATVLMVRTEQGWKIAAVRVLGQLHRR